MKSIDHKTMLTIVKQRVKQDYRTRDRYCEMHGIDKGNFSKALNDKGELSDSMIEPLGYKKEYIPRYTSVKLK